MEAAPLSLAYTHARNAVAETQKANPIAASEEHDLAAGEFANAASSTKDLEALRTLRLLEQHHQRLAELLKYKPEIHATTDDVLGRDHGGHDGTLSTVNEDDEVTTPQKGSDKSPRSAPKSNTFSSDARQHRDLSSSIASNLASARGIQPKAQRRSLQSSTSTSTTAQNVDGQFTSASDDRRNSRRSSRTHGEGSSAAYAPNSPYKSSATTGNPLRVSPTRNGQAASIPPSIVQPGTDDAFTRFYSRVESIGTRLSAALAFTGLPLNYQVGNESQMIQQASEKPPPSLPRDNSRTTPSGSPDVSRFFSRAALKAVREDGGGPGVAESFYVVPTSGGTISYAGMLQGQRQSSALSEVIGEDEFVDASEVPVHASFEGDANTPGRHARARAASLKNRSTVTGTKGAAEQNADNMKQELEYWRAMAKDTGERLKAFEMNAQRESIMAASIYRGGGARSRHHSPESVRGQTTSPNAPSVPRIPANYLRGSSGNTTESSDGAKDQKIKDLEDEVERAKEEIKKCQKENRKLMAVVEKYRKRFEDLKENARERMRAQEEKAKAQQAKEDETSRKDQLMS